MKLQPTVDELLDACACLIVECDALRLRTGAVTFCEGRRQYEPEELKRGREMNPTAHYTPSGCLVIDVNH